MNFQDLRLTAYNRAFICGQTGCGKTFLAEFLLHDMFLRGHHIAVLDSKAMIKWKGYERHTKLSSLMSSKKERLIYAPCLEENNFEYYDKFFKWIYLCRNRVVYVDEVFQVTQRLKIPHFYNGCLTRGRQLGITTVSSSQRPKDLPQTILSEAEQAYIMRLQLEGDRDKIYSTFGVDEEIIAGLPKRKFIYVDTENQIVTSPQSLKLIGGK